MTSQLLAGPLTLFIWLVSLACGGFSFAKTHRNEDGVFRKFYRGLFGGMVALAVWSVTTEALWLMGVPLKIGAIESGRMTEAWWLPGVTVIWAALIYRELKK